MSDRARAARRGRTPAAGAVLTLGVVLLVLVGAVAGGGGLAAADDEVTRALARHREPWLTAAMHVVTWFGSAWLLVPLVVVVAAALAARRRRADAALLLVVAVGATAGESLLKVLVARPRPVLDEVLVATSSYAFPSGHATQAAATWGALALLAARTVPGRWARVGAWAAAAVVVVLVGFSRLYLGVHWLTDVLGGFLLGAGWLLLVAAVVRARRRADAPKGER